MSIIESKVPKVNDSISKPMFEQALSMLDLEGLLALIAVLSQRALYLQQMSPKSKIVKI